MRERPTLLLKCEQTLCREQLQASLIFTARCTIMQNAVQNAVLRLHVVRLSVRPSVALVDQDHIGWKSWKLIAWTIAHHLRSSQLKSHPPTPRGTWGNLGETRRGVGKVACSSMAISLKRVKIDEKLLWMGFGWPIGRSHQRCFER